MYHSSSTVMLKAKRAALFPFCKLTLHKMMHVFWIRGFMLEYIIRNLVQNTPVINRYDNIFLSNLWGYSSWKHIYGILQLNWIVIWFITMWLIIVCGKKINPIACYWYAELCVWVRLQFLSQCIFECLRCCSNTKKVQ